MACDSVSTSLGICKFAQVVDIKQEAVYFLAFSSIIIAVCMCVCIWWSVCLSVRPCLFVCLYAHVCAFHCNTMTWVTPSPPCLLNLSGKEINTIIFLPCSKSKPAIMLDDMSFPFRLSVKENWQFVLLQVTLSFVFLSFFSMSTHFFEVLDEV